MFLKRPAIKDGPIIGKDVRPLTHCWQHWQLEILPFMFKLTFIVLGLSQGLPKGHDSMNHLSR